MHTQLNNMQLSSTNVGGGQHSHALHSHQAAPATARNTFKEEEALDGELHATLRFHSTGVRASYVGWRDQHTAWPP